MPANRANPQRMTQGLRDVPFVDASSRATQWAGRAVIANGQETVTVSTAIVNSDSLVIAFPQGTDTVGSLGNAFCVRTISPGNFFTLGTADSQPVARDMTLAWLVYQTS
jgi:hypothetical protein